MINIYKSWSRGFRRTNMLSPFPFPFPFPFSRPRNLLCSFVLILFLISISPIAMADSSESTPSSTVSPSSEAAVYIVYTEQPQSNEDPEAFHLRTLESVLGSKEAAKGALIYVYKSAATGFSAKLTPEQVAEISKQPGVLQAVKSQRVQLHSGAASFS